MTLIRRLGQLLRKIICIQYVKVAIALIWENVKGEGTATFAILGNICTRSCGFCNVKTGKPLPVDWSEPLKVANLSSSWELNML